MRNLHTLALLKGDKMRNRILQIMAFKNTPKSREIIKVGNKGYIVKYLSIKPNK